MNQQNLKELVRKTLMNEDPQSDLLSDFETKLKNHNWYYMMSDDDKAYSNGSAEESELKKIAKQLSDMGYGGDAAKIFNKYNVFKNNSFSNFITPPEPFIPRYKRKQMGLDEKKATRDFDGDGEIESSEEEYKGVRDKAIKKAMRKEDIDLGHTDNEPHMIKGELYQIGKYAMDLYAILEELEEAGGEYDFPAWWQSKITTAKNMISGAKHYLDFELKEPAIDATVDALTGEEPHMGEPMSPMMEDKDNKHVVMKDGKFWTGIDFVSDIKDARKYNLESATEVAKREKGMVYTPKKINEDEVTKTDELAAKIFNALKSNKSAEDQNNLKQARKALNKGDEEAAEKIAKPYMEEGLPKGFWADKIPGGKGKMEENTKNQPNQYFFDNLYTYLSQYPNGKKFLEDYGMNEPFDLMNRLTQWKDKEKVYKDLTDNFALPQMHKQELDKFFGISEETNTVTKKKAKPYIDESYETLKKKIQGQGKSAKAASAIAGAVAAYKAKGGGKGPTAKQKK